jgi:toxin-antitoxin system PIN domain toxin
VIELLDANVLIALGRAEHSAHDVALRWWRSRPELPFATCPITQGALVRLLIVGGSSVPVARRLLEEICKLPHHEFWPDGVSYLDVDLSGVLGHRQVTDSYLAALARQHGGRLVTFDRGLAVLHPDVVTLIDS